MQPIEWLFLEMKSERRKKKRVLYTIWTIWKSDLDNENGRKTLKCSDNNNSHQPAVALAKHKLQLEIFRRAREETCTQTCGKNRFEHHFSILNGSSSAVLASKQANQRCNKSNRLTHKLHSMCKCECYLLLSLRVFRITWCISPRRIDVWIRCCCRSADHTIKSTH